MDTLLTLVTSEKRKDHLLERLCTLSTIYLHNVTSRKFTFLIITDNKFILHIKIFGNAASTGYNGKKRGYVSKRLYTTCTANLHKVQIDTHERFCNNLKY